MGALTAYERPDRAGAIYWRVLRDGVYEGRKRLTSTIRDAAGRIVPDLENAARAAAQARWESLQSEAPVDEPKGDITVRAGFHRFLHERRGKYAADSTWKGEVTRHSRIILAVLDVDMPWAAVRHTHYRQLWRHMAHEHVKSGEYGVRYAEQVVGTLQTATLWLQGEGLLEPATAQPAVGWRTVLREEWAAITERPLPEPSRPRHTTAEMDALWRALPLAEPRLALGLELAAELRLGQVLRSRRSDVVAHGGFRIGAVRVHGRGKKRGALVVLTREQRHALTRAMIDGYLADMEAARIAGTIDDYVLLPGGYLKVTTVRGNSARRAQPKNADLMWDKRAMRRAWDALQRAAGVRRVRGRGWYGLRRLQADRAEDVTADARVLNTMGGWQHTTTREKYQQESRPEIADQAKTARSAIRPRGKRKGA